MIPPISGCASRAIGSHTAISRGERPNVERFAILYGHQGVLEVLPDHIRLTDRSGRAEVFPVADPPDDSYHAAWFAAVAADFEAAIVPGGTEIARLNLAEARTALSLIVGARRSHQRAGAPVDMPA